MTPWSQTPFKNLRKMPGALTGAELRTGIWFQQTCTRRTNRVESKCSKCVNTADGNTD